MNNESVYPREEPLSPETMLDRIRAYNGELKAIRDLTAPDARKKLHIAVKNNIGLSGFRTSAGCKLFENLELEDAFLVKKLKAAGADLFATTNMTEMAGFVTTANPNMGYSYIGGFPKNPHGNFPPGGSSTGSAIAVAAGFSEAALGTETRGSVMKPALQCGVFGFKPTRGEISRSGIIPLSSILDSPGIHARSLSLLKEIFEIVRGADPEDGATTKIRGQAKHGTQMVSDFSGRNVVLLRLKGRADLSENEETAKKFFLKAGMNIAYEEAEANDSFSYKEISSLDFLYSLNEFIKKHAERLSISNVAEFIEAYRRDSSMSPYGMDRLEDALKFKMRSKEDLQVFAEQKIKEAEELISSVLKKHHADFIASSDFIDWWSVSGAPSIALPVGIKKNGMPIGIMVGAKKGEDENLLAVSEHLMQH